jgi:uncharacterized protein YecT (DUF1311 family)
MTKSQKVLFVIVLFFTAFTSYSQSINEITALEKNYQDCLDKDDYMLGCAKNFYNEIDKILNVTYNNIMSGLDQTQKTALRTEQRSWLKERKAYFTKVDRENEDGLAGNDLKMVRIDKQADYVKERVIYLIKKYKTDTGK